ncbi:MAG: DUF4469 domain-containing protein [Treponema sp.]|jgi:hypothetical protein|nr:DUF4469 domain-containing protein [Treponema sp.]
MAIIDPVNETLHRIRVRLVPNNLIGVEGAYIAFTINEACLGIEDVCASLKNRGGFTGNYDDLVEYVKQFFNEAAYLLCDGFAVNTGYFSIHPNVGGGFDNVTEGHDRRKHPVTFRFRTRAPLRALTGHIAVEVEGIADVQGYIDKVADVNTGAVNETLTPGGLFSISGHKIKVAGDKPDVGVYFVPAADAVQKVKVTGNLAENTASKLIGVIPALTVGTWTVEIKTQYSRGGTFLKEPRTVVFRSALIVEPTAT